MYRIAIVIPATALAVALGGCKDAQAPTSQAARAAATAPGPASTTAAAPAGQAQARVSSDEDLSLKVKRALEDKQAAGALRRSGHIEVAAADGVVTLYGTVAAPNDKERIALLAMDVEGVRSVVNNLVVVQGS